MYIRNNKVNITRLIQILKPFGEEELDNINQIRFYLKVDIIFFNSKHNIENDILLPT